MSKEATVEMYQEEFLAGKSDEDRARFFNKSIEKRYASIMSWRHKKRSKENKSLSAKEIIDHIKLTRSKINGLSVGLNAIDLDNIDRNLDDLKSFISEYRQRLVQNEIETLEKHQEEITRRLRELKGEQ